MLNIFRGTCGIIILSGGNPPPGVVIATIHLIADRTNQCTLKIENIIFVYAMQQLNHDNYQIDKLK